ncbi:MAG: 4Fe-4S binding protein [Candidatus Riflebacteria bacterium]|nr:4Fe-4S binding protein [Candidatus Riflebacteria bacterium]
MSKNTGKIGRADFLKSYLFELLESAYSAFPDELTEFAEKFPELIRPPGAIAEQEFLEKCQRCGACIKACQFHALRPVMQSNEFDLGTPALRVSESYCRFCSDLPCVNACPSGALSLKNKAALQKIAVANIVKASCLRSRGESCLTCLEKCANIAAAVIHPEPAKPPRIDARKCSGCGACAVFCPAYPDNAIKLVRI